MNLTDEEIRIKVAEARGWTECLIEPDGFAWGVNPNLKDNDCGGWMALPDYPESLDACKEFEAALTDDEWNVYCAQIVSLTLWDRATDTVKRILQTTARQRCIAYLKMKGLIP